MCVILHLLKALQLYVYIQAPVADQWLFPIGEPCRYMTLERVRISNGEIFLMDRPDQKTGPSCLKAG